MLRSMTGYGRGEALAGEIKVSTEARSVNHRFLDVSVRSPRALYPFEKNIKKMVSDFVSRGKVDRNADLKVLFMPGGSLF